MSQPRHLFIGLPAYNEAVALPRLLRRIESVSASLGAPVTVIVYNDGSTDRTGDIARAWPSSVPLVLIDGIVNKGLGTGLRNILEHAVRAAGDDDILVVMDCDDTHDPAQIGDMLAALDRGHDVVIGSRFVRGASVRGVPLLRRITAFGAVLLFTLIHPVRGVRDYSCGYRAYRIGALKRLFARYPAGPIEEPGFACMIELLLKLNSIGCRFAEIPLRLRYDLKPTASKMNVGNNIVHVLKLLLRWRQRRQVQTPSAI